MLSQSSILVAWTNRAKIGAYGGAIYIDISVRRSDFPNDTSLDKHNLKYTQDFGSRSSFTFTGLGSNIEYCFRIWSRKEPNGCRSQVPTNPTCKRTPALSGPVTPPPPQKPVRTLGKKLVIGVYREPGNVFRFSGHAFLREAPVTIRVADIVGANVYITHIGTWRITSDSLGKLNVKLSGLCKRAGPLYFSANDGRKSASDKTGTLWTNTVQVTCG
ncbi:MAG: hypothetical protein ACREIP_18255 [Alphaproteobacteria bacterium]